MRGVGQATAAGSQVGSVVLMIEHGRGGGVTKHVAELSALLQDEGVTTLTAVPDESGLRLRGPGRLRETVDLLDLPSASAALCRLGVERLHVHSLLGLDPALIPNVAELAATAALPLTITLHDYTPVCPRLHMFDWSGLYCDSPSTTYCETCLARAGSQFGVVDMERWRADYARLLARAERLIVPNGDVAARYRRYFVLPPERFSIRPHPRRAGAPKPPVTLPPRDGALRVGVFGVLSRVKGSGVLLALAGDALARGLPLRFVVFGYTADVHALNDFANVEVLGRYREEDLDRLLSERPVDLALFPSVVPETFCYALDIALERGPWPVCLDIGAPAARLRALGYGEVWPFRLALEPGAFNDRLLAVDVPADRAAPEEPGRRWISADAYYGPG